MYDTRARARWPHARVKSHSQWPFVRSVPTIPTVHSMRQRTRTQHRSTCEVLLPARGRRLLESLDDANGYAERCGFAVALRSG